MSDGDEEVLRPEVCWIYYIFERPLTGSKQREPRGGPLPKILYEEYIPVWNTLEYFRNTWNVFHYIPKIRPKMGQYLPKRPYFLEF